MSKLRHPKPEDHELEMKRQELAIIEKELAIREAELATVQGSLHQFESRSKAELDPRYEELADLQQRIAELSARIKPADDGSDSAQGGGARGGASSIPKTPPMPRKRRARPEAPQPPPKRPRPNLDDESEFSPADKLKRLYRDVAKAVHPDLAEDDLERQHRHALMVKANEAYDAGDEALLSAIIYEWESSAEAIRGHGTIPDLIRTIRKIHRGKLRLAIISTELHRITGTSLYNLKTMADAAQQYERDLLNEMTGRLDQDIAAAKKQVQELEKLVPPEELASDETEQEESRDVA
jgi:hypothetical protein